MMHTGWIYCLHFREPIHHAQHYTGSTTDLLRRLRVHASGMGSRLTRAMHQRGIGFTLGGLYQAKSLESLRRCERRAKKTHNCSSFCSICKGDGQAHIFEMMIVDPEVPGVPIHSWEYKPVGDDLHVEIDEASIDDVEEIRAVMSAERQCVGFIPAGGEEGINVQILKKRVYVARCEDHVVGYCIWSPTMLMQYARIYHVAVFDRYRLMGIGKRLIEQAIRAAVEIGMRYMQAHVRIDLNANDFWEKIGFFRIGVARHRISKSFMNCYQRPIGEEII